MMITKRSGAEVPFDKGRIIKAINKAFLEIDGEIKDEAISKEIAERIQELVKQNVVTSVEEIQDMVEQELMDTDRKDVAKAYVRYRYKREILRQSSDTYDGILDLVEAQNQELMDENSNKNAIIASTQRDYMAGEVSKDLTMRYLLPSEVVRAHKAGEIHFHDADYFAQHIINCCLINLDDMLQNGTVINKTLIEKPHSFITACNIATQIIAMVASGQYGGQSVSLAHLAPFVDISRQKIKKDVAEEIETYSLPNPDKVIKEITEKRLRQEISQGIQTIQYQINTLNTSNGQTPFVSIFMYLNEVEDKQTKEDLAMIIEEVLQQRILGVKNEVGVYITPAFPKLLYVLEEDNIREDGKYYYLTRLAAKCTAKRLVPDYISEKMMKKLKLSKGETEGNGDCFACMGCRSFLTPDRSGNGFDNMANAKNYKPNKPKYYGRLAA